VGEDERRRDMGPMRLRFELKTMDPQRIIAKFGRSESVVDCVSYNQKNRTPIAMQLLKLNY
jgi:hypothetical protein